MKTFVCNLSHNYSEIWDILKWDIWEINYLDDVRLRVINLKITQVRVEYLTVKKSSKHGKILKDRNHVIFNSAF